MVEIQIIGIIGICIQIEQINCCEGYNSKLNEYFKFKPHIFKLILKLKEEESIIIKKFTQSEFNLLKKIRKDDNNFIFNNIMEVTLRIKDIFKLSDRKYKDLSEQELILQGSMYFKKLNDVINEDYA